MRARAYSSPDARRYFAEEAASIERYEEHQKHLAWARERAPRLWACLDLLGDIWRKHDYPQMTLILGPENVERFERVLSKATRRAKQGVEIGDIEEDRLMTWVQAFREREK